jgi:hypothetical protein
LAYFDLREVKKGRTIVYPAQRSEKIIKNGIYITKRGDILPLLRNVLFYDKTGFVTCREIRKRNQLDEDMLLEPGTKITVPPLQFNFDAE